MEHQKLKTVYLSGPLYNVYRRGQNKMYRRYKLEQQRLEENGLQVVNTYLHFVHNGHVQKPTLRARIKLLMDSDALVLLPEWHRVLPCTIERMVASMLGMDIVYLPDFMYHPFSESCGCKDCKPNTAP